MDEKVDLEVVKKFMRDFLQAVEEDGYVKVVRCKYCKHWEWDGVIPQGYCWKLRTYQCNPEWFCADGERRE